MKTIVFDIDSTLNKLTEHTCRLAGISREKYLKIKSYNINKCEHLTMEEKKRVFRLFECKDTYLSCPAYEGISEISKLVGVGDINVIIHSYCMNLETADAKIEWVKQRLNTVGVQFKMEFNCKNPINNTFAVVEDNLEYLIECKTKYRVIINQPYNQADNYGIKDEDYNIIRVANVKEAIEFINGRIQNE